MERGRQGFVTFWLSPSVRQYRRKRGSDWGNMQQDARSTEGMAASLNAARQAIRRFSRLQSRSYGILLANAARMAHSSRHIPLHPNDLG